MVKYAFESLSESNFEAMTVDICQTLFGVGVHAFAAGRDGGRDSYFEGVAERYPSSISPWSGRIIIQAKHTTTIGASCSDNDFFVNQSSVLHKEVYRIKEIKKVNILMGIWLSLIENSPVERIFKLRICCQENLGFLKLIF